MAKLLKVPQIDVGMEVLHLNLVQGQFFHTLFPPSFFTFALSIQSALNMWNVGGFSTLQTSSEYFMEEFVSGFAT